MSFESCNEWDPEFILYFEFVMHSGKLENTSFESVFFDTFPEGETFRMYPSFLSIIESSEIECISIKFY